MRKQTIPQKDLAWDKLYLCFVLSLVANSSEPASLRTQRVPICWLMTRGRSTPKPTIYYIVHTMYYMPHTTNHSYMLKPWTVCSLRHTIDHILSSYTMKSTIPYLSFCTAALARTLPAHRTFRPFPQFVQLPVQSSSSPKARHLTLTSTCASCCA